MDVISTVSVVLTFLNVRVAAKEDSNICPFTKYERYIRFYYPVTGYIYCATGCCGYVDDRSCCPAPADFTGIYVGCVSGAIVMVVTIVAITICCVAKNHRKNVVVDIGSRITRPTRISSMDFMQPSTFHQRRQYDTVPWYRNKSLERPPPYELAVYTIPEEEPERTPEPEVEVTGIPEEASADEPQRSEQNDPRTASSSEMKQT